MPRGPAVAAGAAGKQTIHTKLPYITPGMTISFLHIATWGLHGANAGSGPACTLGC